MGLVWEESKNNTHTLPITQQSWVIFLQSSNFINVLSEVLFRVYSCNWLHSFILTSTQGKQGKLIMDVLLYSSDTCCYHPKRASNVVYLVPSRSSTNCAISECCFIKPVRVHVQPGPLHTILLTFRTESSRPSLVLPYDTTESPKII